MPDRKPKTGRGAKRSGTRAEQPSPEAAPGEEPVAQDAGPDTPARAEDVAASSEPESSVRPPEAPASEDRVAPEDLPPEVLTPGDLPPEALPPRPDDAAAPEQLDERPTEAPTEPVAETAPEAEAVPSDMAGTEPAGPSAGLDTPPAPPHAEGPDTPHAEGDAPRLDEATVPPPAGAAGAGARAGADTPPHEPPPADPHEGDEQGEEGGRSLAATLLIALLLLLAGAAIGLWAGPRIAPHLPAGMAPVAAWLTPAQDRLEARMDRLEADTQAELAALRAEIPDAAAAGDIDARLAELEAQLGGQVETFGEQLTALSDDLAALDGAETRERLSRLEAAVDGQQETLANLRDQLAAVDPAEATAQIDVYEAELAGLRGEVRDVAGQVGALSRRIDEVAAAAERQIDLAREQVETIEAEAARGLTRAEIEADLAAVRSALASGAPYAEAVESLGAHPEVTLPEGLTAPAAEGVPTLASLRTAFSDAAHDALRADIQARAPDTVAGRARAFFEAQVASRSLEPRPGMDTDSVLSRIEHALRQDALAAALQEAEGLPPEAAEAMSGWLAAARTRVEAVEGFRTVEAELSAMN